MGGGLTGLDAAQSIRSLWLILSSYYSIAIVSIAARLGVRRRQLLLERSGRGAARPAA